MLFLYMNEMFEMDQSMYCPFIPVPHTSEFWRQRERRRWQNIVRKGESDMLLDMCVVNVKCLCWTSPCIVPLTLYHTIPTLRLWTNNAFENIAGKGENAVLLYMYVSKCQI